MSRGAWLAPILLLSCLLAAPARAGGVAVIATRVVTTKRRTLTELPLKRIITDAKGWAWVTEDLAGAPPAPDFAKGQACVLVVADLSGGAKSWIDRVRPSKDGAGLRIRLVRQPGKPEVLPHLKCVFLTVDRLPSGVDLEHQTRLEGGMGTVSTHLRPTSTDANPNCLPQLGPDLRLKVRMKNGAKLPDGVKLRYEAYYPGNDQLPDRVETVPFPTAGLPYPRIVKDSKGASTKHVYAAFGPGLRSAAALRVSVLPRISKPRGCRPPIRFTFKLEPIPRADRR